MQELIDGLRSAARVGRGSLARRESAHYRSADAWLWYDLRRMGVALQAASVVLRRARRRMRVARTVRGGQSVLQLLICSGVLLFAYVAASAHVDGRTAAQTATAGPGARNAHGLAFDGRVALLFGGASERAVLDDTWAWDGRMWRRLDRSGPPARTFPLMVSAPGDGAYLFGGRRVLFGTDLQATQLLSDLWRWDGQRWVTIGADGPRARAEAAGAWDHVRQRLVVFGGYTISDSAVHPLGDTWEFGDGSWREYRGGPSPSPRHGAVAAWDATIGEVVLFGGNGGMSDSWAWNGTRWRRLDAGAVPGRYNAAAATGADGLPVLRFGGWDGRRRHGDSWVLSDGAWRRMFDRVSRPAARNHAAMTYDSVRRRFVMVGGHDGHRVFGDVWEADARGWRRAHAVAPRRRVDNQH